MSAFDFFALFITVFAAAAFLWTYSDNARLLFLKITGNKLVRDYGVFSEDRMFAEHQILRLFEFEKKGEKIFVLEEKKRLTSQGARDVHWHRFSEEGMQKLLDILSQEQKING